MAQFENQSRNNSEAPQVARSLGVPLGEFQSLVREHRDEAQTDPQAFAARVRGRILGAFDSHGLHLSERVDLSTDVDLKIQEAQKLAAYYRALDRRGLLK